MEKSARTFHPHEQIKITINRGVYWNSRFALVKLVVERSWATLQNLHVLLFLEAGTR